MHDLFPAGAAPAPGSVHERYVADRLAGWSRGGETLPDAVRRHAAARPDGIAFVAGDDRLTWAQFDARSTAFARRLAGAGLPRGARVGVLLPDGVEVHVAYLAAMKAGMVVVAIGPRAGRLEVRHLLTVGGATALDQPVPAPWRARRAHSSRASASTYASKSRRLEDGVVAPKVARMSCAVARSTCSTPRRAPPACRSAWCTTRTGGSTSTSSPSSAGDLHADDVFLTLIPAPYGFAQWTANFTPTLLGAPTVVMPRFDADEALRAHRARTGHRALLRQHAVHHDAQLAGRVRALRPDRRCGVMFTGGEAVPFERAAEFERRTGAKVLQFFGSNETGALSRTTVDRHGRPAAAHRRAGHRRRCRCGCSPRTAPTSPPPAAPARPPARARRPASATSTTRPPTSELFTPDGWMLTGDICTVDADGYLRGGRTATSDFIIRGGKNISAAAVEDQVGCAPRGRDGGRGRGARPDVRRAGVRASWCCAPAPTLDLDELARAPRRARGVARRTGRSGWRSCDDLPRGSGGKVAKGELRQRLRA